jgi:leader peptidase (prepilin peptidase)/N-methyltransferase
MSDTVTHLDTAAACAAAAAVLGVLAPLLVARLPEPEPDPDRPAPATPKEPYAAIAARPGFRLRTAIWSAVFAALFGAVLGWDWALLYLVPLTPLAVVLSVVDWRTKLLPTRLIVPAYLFLLPVLVVLGLVTGDWSALWLALGAGVAVRGFYWVFWRFTRSGMGFGDVRLAGLIGLALGFLGWGELLVGVYAGFLLGALIGGVLAVAKVIDRKSYPFGPFMLVGAALGVLLGPVLGSVSPY